MHFEGVERIVGKTDYGIPKVLIYWKSPSGKDCGYMSIPKAITLLETKKKPIEKGR
ncbi:hypothetical protein GCM10011571_17520 [Marinithermofilum abyssi]|uniref:Uncharacterized protein n=1 Tax=Marinithermofilum abyssi TaxID=1571185 RepID=A0A8J2VCU8_9BACL|nr:hypothetical protein GCM10011571_17520 [Marinithermofilum abyssi]